jgi:hypothetical protein
MFFFEFNDFFCSKLGQSQPLNQKNTFLLTSMCNVRLSLSVQNGKYLNLNQTNALIQLRQTEIQFFSTGITGILTTWYDSITDSESNLIDCQVRKAKNRIAWPFVFSKLHQNFEHSYLPAPNTKITTYDSWPLRPSSFKAREHSPILPCG